MSSTVSAARELADSAPQPGSIQRQRSQTAAAAACDRNQSTSISSSSSLLTNSSTSPSSSLTSISTNSPTSTSISNSQSMRSVSVCLNSSETPPLDGVTFASAPPNQPQLSATVAEVGTDIQRADRNTDIEAPANGDGSALQDDIRAASAEHANLDKEARSTADGSMSTAAAAQTESRQERSNSCSQAETCGVSGSALTNIAIGSLSHESLSNQANGTVRGDAAADAEDAAGARRQQQDGAQVTGSQISGQKQQASLSSAKFFSSKLNTGSLWSLLSAGSTNSAGANEPTSGAESTEPAMMGAHLQQQSEAGKSVGDKSIQGADHSNNKLGSFFSRVQFKRNTHPASSSENHQTEQKQAPATSHNIYRMGSSESMGPDPNAQGERSRFRFSLKYIGSALLHKNFTLPMLEWIAKDIRRQTVRGAQSTSQRQFSIPTRDIVLEIQSYQLTAISCKDGHCVFVHPMHRVSKYAQLQHDPTCFSYLIRDSKESPLFCHVFQAKSAHKVHDIFRAIREATTQTQVCPPALPPPPLPPPIPSLKPLDALGFASGVRKSASQELRGLLGQRQATEFRQQVSLPAASPAPATIVGSESNPARAQLLTAPGGRTVSQRDPSQSANQFESSYQFEVMFVKKVKLQCRRVPASFVDDALETLKSFEVLKGGDPKTQIKGLGKRIISASVDERQEYDEACQSPTPSGPSLGKGQPAGSAQQQPRKAQETRPAASDNSRGSPGPANDRREAAGGIKEERESRSCKQSPTKSSTEVASSNDGENPSAPDKLPEMVEIKKHQSLECLRSIDCSIRSAKDGKAPVYSNDFSPYNTITSTDLNERIAAIPVVSSSVSLDHETRQRLARQVRETIMATAANIKKGVYASGDKLDSSASSKALDSLSCTSASFVAAIDDTAEWTGRQEDEQLHSRQGPSINSSVCDSNELERVNSCPDQRRSSASASSFQHQQSANNNFDLFRRASARQVVKNRTMLLLIGKDELCTISIDKHQMLFSKSFSSIVHCLQGSNNKDHFGLICRDSGKINPNAESYAGFIFKCQSEKVVREIMGALKQVIYSSQHNYHGYNSPYNPLNAVSIGNKYKQPHQQSPKLERAQLVATSTPAARIATGLVGQAPMSLAAKRGFLNPLELDEAAGRSVSLTSQQSTDSTCIPSPSAQTPLQSSVLASPMTTACSVGKPTVSSQPKNLIKSMFCDNCPLYWYHRLCCDIESLPAEASKAIILRRIDSSLSEKEQDELYSRFSEFNIESVDEHNEIFMSLLRHQCEKKQAKHSQSQGHLDSLAKNARQSSTSMVSRQTSTQREPSSSSSSSSADSASHLPFTGGHQRSGSSGGSLAFVISQANANQAGQSIADAGSAAMDNLKKAKNSISSSIENILKRRSSMRDEQDQEDGLQIMTSLPARSGSFKSSSRESRANEVDQSYRSDSSSSLKRSQSTSDYSKGQQPATGSSVTSWKDSLSRTLNDDLANPLVGLFRRRNSLVGSKGIGGDQTGSRGGSTRASTEQLSQSETSTSLQHSPRAADSRFTYTGQYGNSDEATPSSMLSSAFWKKSIFDKIRQPMSADDGGQSVAKGLSDNQKVTIDCVQIKESSVEEARRRTPEELRSLWRKAINEQITLLKMEKQNRGLQATAQECNAHSIKLNYKDISYPREVPTLWDKLLKQDPTKKVEFVEVARLIRRGVPKQRRGEIWMFLMNQYQLRHGTSFQSADSEFHGDANQTYRSLLSQLSVQQHDIFVDIGRTFPSHPYYSQYLGIGQLTLFNLLKAYSLLDPEVGYCQGLSFVAGILLLHVNTEDEAFELMRHLLFNFGLRKQYLPSMNALHLQLYQMTRLLRDHEYKLFNLFDHYDISPSLYAAPWFLTLFASQFPLGFVARLFDLISLIGIEAIFRVSLNLLAYHRDSILACTSLDSTMDYMKNSLVKIDDKNLISIFDKSMSLDLRNKLIEYEIEYTFYCAEDKARFTADGHHQNAMDKEDKPKKINDDNAAESTSVVADATATVIIQHLLANNHLKSLRSNYSY